MNNNEIAVEYGRSIGVEAQPDVIIELTEQGPQGAHGEKGDKGDTGTVTPEMLAILDRVRTSATEAAQNSATAVDQANQASQFRNNAYTYYQQTVQLKADTQAIKDEATKTVGDIARESKQAIIDTASPALNEIRNSNNEAKAAINEVRQARDIAKSSATDAQSAASKAASDAKNVLDAYSDITTIQTNLNALSDKTEIAAQKIIDMDKNVSDNCQTVKTLKDDIDAAKSTIDEQSAKVSSALSAVQTAHTEIQKYSSDAVTAGDAAVKAKEIVESSVASAKNAATTTAEYLEDVKSLADKTTTLKPAIDEAIEKYGIINEQISNNKSVIEDYFTNTQDSANKAAESAKQAATSEANASTAATQVASDKIAVEKIQDSVNDVDARVTTALGQVDSVKNDIKTTLEQAKTVKNEVDTKWNDFSSIYYGARSTAPTGDIKLGALWLDTSEQPEVLRKYISTGWEVVAATDVFTKTEVVNMFKALSADKINETDNAKIMTADERYKIASLDEKYLSKAGGVINGDLRVNETITTNSWVYVQNSGDIARRDYSAVRFEYTNYENVYCDIAYYLGESLNIYLNGTGDVAKFRNDGTTRFANTVNIGDRTFWSIDGNITGSRWNENDLYKHIENRAWWYGEQGGAKYNQWCVTDSRYTGWAEIASVRGQWVSMPSGYLVTAIRASDPSDNPSLGGTQPQLYMDSRGWYPLGGW